MEIGNSVSDSVGDSVYSSPQNSIYASLTKPIYGSVDVYLRKLVFESIRIPVHTSVVGSVWVSIVSNEYRKK